MAELLLFCEAFVISFLLTGITLSFSLKKSLLDVPNARSSHEVPKPRLGGVAITCAFYVSTVTLFCVHRNPLHSSGAAAGVLSGGALLALVGLLDDLRGLDARLKLLAQVAAASIVAASGVVLTELSLPLIGSIGLGQLGVPFTIVWIVGVVNFYNFIDGIDGLAAGIGVIASLFLLLIGFATGAPELGALYAILAGSSFGFLRYNFPPARIFMGDMGSTFIGFLFGVLSVAGSSKGIPVFVTFLLLGTVIGDAVLTLLRRIVSRERIFAAHRTHYYQRLISLGLSHKQVTLLEYLVVVLLGISAYFTFRGDRIFVTFFSVVWVGFFLWVLAKIRSMERGARLFWEGGTLATAIGDVLFIAASYVLSYYLRLSFRFPEAETASMIISLPIVLVIRTAVFYYYGLYRGVWRYTTFDDLVRIVKAVSLGSAVMVVSFTLLFRFKAFPRSVFIIDWFILTVLVAGSRTAARWFHELPSREEVTGRRIAIGGTGPVSEAILHHVKKAHGMIPVGYFDDRRGMAGRMIHGLEVLGPFSRARELALRHEIDEIIVTDSLYARLSRAEVDDLRREGVEIRVVTDPAEIAPGGDVTPLAGACAGMRVLVAGSGQFIEHAGSLFREAGELVLVSNEAKVLAAARRSGEPRGATVSVYHGILGDRRSIGSIVIRHEPQIVFMDCTAPVGDVSNPLEAYLSTVLFAAERLSSQVERLRGVRLVVLTRSCGGGGDLDRVERMLELVLRDRFRRQSGRLTILRLGRDVSPAGCAGAVVHAVDRGGAICRVHAAGDGSPPSIEEIDAPPVTDDIGALYLELRRGFERADGARMRDVLGRLTDRAVVGEHD